MARIEPFMRQASSLSWSSLDQAASRTNFYCRRANQAAAATASTGTAVVATEVHCTDASLAAGWLRGSSS